MPKISIILPFLNPGRDFESALQSVFAQTFTDWELLLMDDGSTDHSPEYARSIRDPRVRVFSDGHCLRLSRRLNMLIDEVAAPVIARMDADDLMHPDRLAIQYSELQRHDENTVVGTGLYSMDTECRITGVRYAPKQQHYGWAATRSACHATIMAPASWFRKYRYSEAALCHRVEDVDLYLRSSRATRFVNLQTALYYYREVGNFSLEKYVASMAAMTVLSTRFADKSRVKATLLAGMYLTKMAVATGATITGNTRYLTSRRSADVPEPELAAAYEALEVIKATPVPVLNGRSDAGPLQTIDPAAVRHRARSLSPGGHGRYNPGRGADIQDSRVSG